MIQNLRWQYFLHTLFIRAHINVNSLKLSNNEKPNWKRNQSDVINKEKPELQLKAHTVNTSYCKHCLQLRKIQNLTLYHAHSPVFLTNHWEVWRTLHCRWIWKKIWQIQFIMHVENTTEKLLNDVLRGKAFWSQRTESKLTNVRTRRRERPGNEKFAKIWSAAGVIDHAINP